jgi:hypothetical protein
MITIAFVIVLVSSLLAGAYTVSVGLGATKNLSSQSNVNNSATSVSSISSVDNLSTFTTEQPPMPKNGSIPQAVVACYNYSVAYTALVTHSTVAAAANSSVESITIKVLCNGCGITSDNSRYTPVAQNTPVQWKGSYGDGNRTVSVNGICDETFGFDRVYPSAWNVQWSFQRISSAGTLEVIVSLDNNQTVVFDKTASASSQSSTISGSLSVSQGS